MTDPDMYYETLYKRCTTAAPYCQSGHRPIPMPITPRSPEPYQIYTMPEGQYLVGTNGKLNLNATLGWRREYYYTPDNRYNELFLKGNLRQEYNLPFRASDKIN